MEKLTNDNFLIYCAKHYNKSHIHNDEEFLEDVDRVKYIKKLLTRYISNGDLKERLILNHIIILHNVFGLETAKILYVKLKNEFSCVKPFLIMLNIMPTKIYNVGSEDTVNLDMIKMDENIVAILRTVLDEKRQGNSGN